MNKEISGCCRAEVIKGYGTTICKECGYFPCGTIEVSECCEAEIEVSMPEVNSYMESPPDPIECCSECGKEIK